MSNEKCIYDLKLHETIVAEGQAVTRVPGGWIYILLGVDIDKHNSILAQPVPVFVPFNDEFDPHKNGAPHHE